MDIHQSMDIPSPSDIIAQTLLGLREWSDYESERQDCSLAKGEQECERIPTFSEGAKGEVESSTLASEENGEAEVDVRFQDEILIKTVREIGQDEDLTSVFCC